MIKMACVLVRYMLIGCVCGLFDDGGCYLVVGDGSWWLWFGGGRQVVVAG